MTQILEIILIVVWLIGCVVVGFTLALIFNINHSTFDKSKTNPEEQPKGNKIPSAETRRPDGGFSISS